MDKIIGIYCIHNVINNKKYIGQSKNIENRFYQHRHKLNQGKHCNQLLQNDWIYYGEKNFKFEIVCKCSDEKLDYFENYYINKYKTTSDLNGYNLYTGGKSKFRYSDLACQHSIMSHQFESNPVYQINLSTGDVTLWSSLRRASKELNISFSCIWNCAENKRKTYKECIWVYPKNIKNINLKNYINSNTQNRHINQFDLDHVFIKQWNSANQAKEDGFDCSAIIKCCKGKYKNHHGFIFEYAKSEENIEKIIMSNIRNLDEKLIYSFRV